MSPTNTHLPEPTTCNCCGSTKVRFINNVLLFGYEKGEWPYIWHCDDCGAYVGCHLHSRSPMGKLADKETREARQRAHKAFDKIWRKERLCSRTKAYLSLGSFLKLNRDEAHIAMLDAEQCEQVETWAKWFAKEWKSKKKEKSVYRKGKKVTKRPNIGGKRW